MGSQCWVAGAVIKNGRLLLTQRPGQGLLAGMWEFPGGAIGDKEDARQACVEKLRETVGIEVGEPTHVASVRHAYTHFKLRLELFLCSYRSGRIRRNGPAACRWVRPDRLERFPLHRVVHKALPELMRSISEVL
ncbi:MAG: NUDIX domain-containing protein [Desulfatitalea sp.]